MLAEASFGLRIYGINSDCNISGFVFLYEIANKMKKVSAESMNAVGTFILYT